MGRSNPCLRIIPCAGGDPAEKETDELDVFETKNSNEKRGWSFRKKSSRHQVLSNSLVSENRPSESKSTLRSALLRSPSGDEHDDQKLSEKVSLVTSAEQKTHQLPVPVDTKVSGTDGDVSTTAKNLDSKASEASADTSATGKNVVSKGCKTNDVDITEKNIETKAPETGDEVSMAKNMDTGGFETNDVNISERNLESKATETDDGVTMEKNKDTEGSETNGISIVEKNKNSEDLRASADIDIVERHVGLKASDTNDASSVITEEKNIDSEGSETNNEASRFVKEETPEVIGSKESDTDEVAPAVEAEVDCGVEEKLDESVVIFIQSAIRGFLARRELLKLKKAVKLQAAFRGHLVRRNAVGALRCVQAIVKMQALVRARLSVEDNLVSAASDKKNMVTRGKTTPASIQKLLENKFARQLMDSTSKKEPIGIKCDTSKPNSAWNWLERWMSVSSTDKKSPKQVSDAELQEQDKSAAVTSPVEPSAVQETSIPVESEDINLVVYKENKTSPCESETAKSLEQPHFENFQESVKIVETSSALIDSRSNQCEVPEITYLESANETSVPPERSVDAVSSEKSHLENMEETDLQSVGSRTDLGGQSGNLAFISARSKFEELALSAKKPVGSSSSNGGDVVSGELVSDTVSSTAESNLRNDERIRFGESEVDTVDEFRHETKDAEQDSRGSDKIVEKLDVAVTEASVLSESVEFNQEKLDVQVKESPVPGIVEDRQDIVDHVKDGAANSVVSEVEQKQETISTPGDKKHSETETGKNPSPGSQAASVNTSSIKAKKEITEKTSASNQKRKSGSSKSKKSPSNPKLDSGASEQSGKDHKSGKRRISFGQDQEPKENGASGNDNSVIPRFMKPTESARAKVHLEHGSSPRSSPDVQERDKKRQSLPGPDKKQVSPRIQRSLSQAQPGGTKERKWLR